MKYLFLIVLLALTISYSHGQNLNSARSASLGNSGIALNDFWTAIHYQAALPTLDKTHVGINILSNSISADLNQYQLAFNIPTNNAGFGFSASKFGNGNYNETQLNVGYGKKLSEEFSAGIQLCYFGVNQAINNGNSSNFYFKVGFRYLLQSNLIIAAHITNPGKLSKDLVEISEAYKLGFCYEFHENSSILLDFNYHSIWKLSIHTGLEIHIRSLDFRIGYASKPEKFCIGIGINYKNLRLDLSNAIHAELGNGPQLSLTYKL